MGNPFGKIIQNGVEYDVSPYAHKIEVPFVSTDTYGSALTKVYTALRAQVSNLTDIKSAKLIMAFPSQNSIDQYDLTSRDNYGLHFSSCIAKLASANIYSANVVNSGSYYTLSFNSQLTPSYNNYSNTSIGGSGSFILYYS